MNFRSLRSVPHISLLLLLVSTVPLMAQETAHWSIDASKTGAKIDRNLFGQFAENLGHGLYEGIWVGPDSPIPNTRGIRNDVVDALRELKVPNVRWPGGCFADEYHWRNGIGPAAQRPATLNSTWGGVVDTNAFGTDEFMDFIQQIGSQPYVSVNVGSRNAAGSGRVAGIHDCGRADGAGQGARRQRSSRSLQGRLPGHRQRELGLRRRHDARTTT